MDFSLTDEQVAFADLAAQVLHVDDTGLCAPPGSSDARATWRRLADAGLVQAVLPTELGGAGLGALGTSMLLEEVGRNAAGGPAVPAFVLATVPLTTAGIPGTELLDRLAAGDLIAVGAYQESPGGGFSARAVTARAVDGQQVELDGTKTAVVGADLADAFVVSTRLDGENALAVVERDARGLAVLGDADDPTGFGIRLAGTPGRVLSSGRAADEALDRTWQHTLLGSAALVAGACERTLRLTCAHVASRRQFGRALAEFQAVSLRAADAHIDVESIRAATLNAAWQLDESGTAPAAVLVAKAWAGIGGGRVLRAAHHLHGGLGVDLSYPLHVLSRLVRREELAYGPPDHHVARIGELIAAGDIDHES